MIEKFSKITVKSNTCEAQYIHQGVHCSLQSKWRLVHSFLNIQETQIQNLRSIGPNITLQRDQNKNLWPSAADRPNLAVLKLSRAEPLQPYFWAKFFEILDLRSLDDMESLGFLPVCLKMFLKIGKHPNLQSYSKSSQCIVVWNNEFAIEQSMLLKLQQKVYVSRYLTLTTSPLSTISFGCKVQSPKLRSNPERSTLLVKNAGRMEFSEFCSSAKSGGGLPLSTFSFYLEQIISKIQ